MCRTREENAVDLQNEEQDKLERTRILLELAEGISTDDLEHVAVSFPALLSAAVDELAGKLEFISVQRCIKCHCISSISGICRCEES